MSAADDHEHDWDEATDLYMNEYWICTICGADYDELAKGRATDESERGE